MANKKYLKEKYLEVREEAYKNGKLVDNVGVYSTAMIAALRDMAENDVYPDGNFGDDECNVWSMFHSYCPKYNRGF